ncbi:MAG TPA: PAS domain S-box protein, partial [Chitinophagaceae bacterium]|nr:PAS domain S-box protein [Chitinophagaceae bacterium]
QKLLEQYAPPSVVVNEEYEIVHMSEKVGKYFEFGGGEPTQNLLKLIKPEIRLELRSALFQAVQHKAAIESRNINLVVNGEPQLLQIHVRPVLKNGDTTKGFILIVFEHKEDLQDETTVMISSDEPVAKQLEDELNRLKSQLRNSVEQHEYQAEELKASNEELQAMNEELRSAAEELETSKEELQSINEELRTVNQELKVKIEESSITSNNLQNLINSAAIGTIFLDRNFSIRMFTPAVLEVFNLKSSDLGRPITDITNKLYYNELLEDAESVLDKLTLIEREVLTTDARTFVMRLLPYRTSEDRINGVVVTFFDITKRKQTENALKQSEEYRRLLIESAKDYAIFTQDAERRIVSWSSGAEKMMGYTEAEILGKRGDIIFTPEDLHHEAPVKEVEKAANDGKAENERWHVRKDGSHFWGSGSVSPLQDNEGKSMGFVKIMRDLTTARRLEESKFFLASIVHTSNDSIITIDFDRNITSWNKAAEYLYGYTSEEAIGKKLSLLTLPEDFQEILKKVDAVEHSREVLVFDTVRHKKGNDLVNLEVVMSPVLNSAGDVIGVSTIARDVTHRKRREENLAFLASINLDFAPLLTIDRVMDDVGKQLADYLNLSRCHFTLVDEKEDRMEVVYEYKQEEKLPSLLGVHSISGHMTEEGRNHYKAGKPVLINAAGDSPLLKKPARVLKEQGLGSLVDVPHFEGGEWKFLVTIARSEVSEWRDDEVDLIKELTSKMYIRIERARAEEEMRKSEEKYRTLFETIDEGFAIQELLTDENGNVTDLIYREVNEAYAQHTGIKNAMGKKASELFPHLEQHWLDNMIHVYKTGEPVRTEGYQSDMQRWFTLQYSSIGGPGSPFIAAVFNDITERKSREQQQAFLLKFSDTLRKESDVDAIANTALQMLSEHLKLDRCYVGVYQLDEDRGVFPYQVGNERVLPMPASVRLSEFPDAMRVAFERTLVIDDVAKAEGLADTDRKNLGALGLCALIAATLRGGEVNPLWSIVAVSASPRGWTLNEVKLIEEVTERTWAALERAQAEVALRKSEEQLANELIDTRQLQRISSQIIQEDNVENLYEQVVDAAMSIMHSSAASIQLYVPEKKALLLLAHKGFMQESAEHWQWVSMNSTSNCAAALSNKQRMIMPDVENVDSLAGTDDLRAFHASNIRSVQSTPLISRTGTIVGMMSTHWPDVYQPTEREFGLLDVLARQVADLFERQQAYEALLQSESRFRILTNAIPQVIWTNYGNGHANYFNQRWYEFSGLSYEESEGLGWQAIVHPDDAPSSVEKWQKALAEGVVFDTEYRLRRHDGSYCWFIGRNVPLKDNSGNVTGWFGSATDIENLKITEEALSQSEARLKITMESATDYGIITMDTQRRVEKWSQGATQLFQYTESEMIGESADIIYTDDDRKIDVPEKEMEIARGNGRAADERWHLRKDGSRFFASGVMRPIENSELTGYVKILRDVTQQQLFTEELHRLVA